MPKRNAYKKTAHETVRKGHAYHSQGVLPKVPYHEEEMDLIASVFTNLAYANPVTINMAHFQKEQQNYTQSKRWALVKDDYQQYAITGFSYWFYPYATEARPQFSSPINPIEQPYFISFGV